MTILIGDACQIRNFKRNRSLRIYKSTEPVHDLAIYDFYRTDLYDPVTDRTKTCCLNIKDNVCIIQCLIPGIPLRSLSGHPLHTPLLRKVL